MNRLGANTNGEGLNKIIEDSGKEKGGMDEETKEEHKVDEVDEIDWTKEWNKVTIKDTKIWDENEGGTDNLDEGDDFDDIDVTLNETDNENIINEMQEEKYSKTIKSE